MTGSPDQELHRRLDETVERYGSEVAELALANAHLFRARGRSRAALAKALELWREGRASALFIHLDPGAKKVGERVEVHALADLSS